MSRFGAKKGRKLPGTEFTWEAGADPAGEADTAPTPLFPRYNLPRARPLNPHEQKQVDLYRALRDRFHDGPYYSVLQSSSVTARKDEATRAHFDPFHGMPTYSGKYQKQKRDRPELKGRPYVMKFFPRHLWKTIQPNFNPSAAMDGYVPHGPRIGVKRGFEDEEEEEDVEETKRRKGVDEDEDAERAEREEDGDVLDPDEDQEEDIVDNDFSDDDDEMGGDYNAEQYFDAGEDEYGENDGFADGGGGGGDEDTY